MSGYKTWIIVSRQVNPNDFYVKVDGSDSYTAFWVACSNTKEAAISLVQKTAAELVLGDTQIIHAALYSSEYPIQDPNVVEKIESTKEKLGDREDIQLATWVSSNAGLW